MLTMPLINLGRWLNHSMPQFPHLYNRADNSAYLTGLLRRLNGLTQAKHLEQCLVHRKLQENSIIIITTRLQVTYFNFFKLQLYVLEIWPYWSRESCDAGCASWSFLFCRNKPRCTQLVPSCWTLRLLQSVTHTTVLQWTRHFLHTQPEHFAPQTPSKLPRPPRLFTTPKLQLLRRDPCSVFSFAAFCTLICSTVLPALLSAHEGRAPAVLLTMIPIHLVQGWCRESNTQVFICSLALQNAHLVRQVLNSSCNLLGISLSHHYKVKKS